MSFTPNAAKRRRLEQYVRAGAGFVRPENTVDTPGAALAAPVTLAQLGEPVTIYFETIFGGSGTTYPQINPWLQTGAADRIGFVTISSGVFGAILPDDSTLMTVNLGNLPNPPPPFGRFSGAIYVDPVAGVGALFVNGDLVAEETYPPNAGQVWGQTTGWNYLTGPPVDADEFDFKPVEIFPGFKPAIL